MSPLPDSGTPRPRLAVVGGGPAGLMAAETLLDAGWPVDLYERLGSVGRKFLLAGKGGLNLTHGEPFDDFVRRYRERQHEVAAWLQDFGADALRRWARDLGVETFVGSSGRVFPSDLKAAPLLRGWVRRLRTLGLRIHVQHRLTGIDPGADGRHRLHLHAADGPFTLVTPGAVLALGGGSWPQLGSDGSWTAWLPQQLGADTRPLVPANGGFECDWSAHFADRYAGQPVKPVRASWTDVHGTLQTRQGEFVVTANGVEGSLVYAASADLRARIAADGFALLHLDLAPERPLAALAEALARPRGKRSIGDHLRRSAQLDGVRAGLVFEQAGPEVRNDPARLAALIKQLPLRLLRCRPLAEAISSAGGLCLEALDPHLMLRAHPGLCFAGEMLDWEAPTGGYLLTASFASGRRAAQGLLRRLDTCGGYAAPA